MVGEEAVAALRSLWEWQKTVQEFAPDDVVHAVRKVLDEAGDPGNVVANYAATSAQMNSTGNYSGNFGNTDSGTPLDTGAVRDYNKDLQTIQGIKNISLLSDYEVELKRISNTFNQLAPYVHGPEDLRQEEAALEAMANEAGGIATYKTNPDGSKTLAGGALYECIKATKAPKGYVGDGGAFPANLVTKDTPRYIKEGGPTGRVSFLFTTSNDGKLRALPAWLLEALPPTQSFLPNWHVAQGQGLKLFGKNPFPNDGQEEYPAGVKDTAFTTVGTAGNFFGDTMSFYRPNTYSPSGTVPAGTYVPPDPAHIVQTLAPGVNLDDNKLLRNDDIATINLQPILNALVGLENALRMFP